jgi:uncharacterized hydrophobic protein (TIGR00341 family)
MSLRLVKIVVPRESEAGVLTLLSEEKVRVIAVEHLATSEAMVEALVDLGSTERVLDALEEGFGYLQGFRAVLIAVEATIPRPSVDPLLDEDDAAGAGAESAAAEIEPATSISRIYREELYATLSAAANWTRVHQATIVLSTIVAAVGLIQSSTAVIIGAMVIAPLLGPNMALALGTTFGDTALIGRALRTGLGGLLMGLILAVVVALIAQPDLGVHEIAMRTEVGLADVALALASGAAGALAFTSGAPAALIGVMVAVALMPPLVVLGMTAAALDFELARGAGLLLVTNVICVNLAAMLTFRAQGLNPRSWWENARAQRSMTAATIIWTVLLAALVTIIVWAER